VLSGQARTVRDLAQGLGFLPDGRTVRACAGAAEDRRRRLDLAPGRDPVGVESKRGEEFGDREAKLELD
jgi:hypothetical protein